MIGKTKQANRNYYSKYIILAWIPSVAQVSKSYSHRHLNNFTGKLNFRCNSRPTQLRIPKPSPKTFPWAFRVPQSKFEANRSRSFWIMVGQTNKHADRQTNRDTSLETHAVYPHMNDFTGKPKFTSLSRPTQPRISKPG